MDPVRRLDIPARGATSADFARGSITFIGTATVILRYAGFALLTDPNFLHAGDHVHLGYGLTSKRLTEPAIDISELPALDLVLLSHYHGDHFDRIAEEQLDKELPIVTTRHAAQALAKKGFRATEPLATWQTISVDKGQARLQITAMPGRHGPGIFDALLPPVMGSLLAFQDADARTRLRIYVSGDTLHHDELKEIPRRYPEIDLALLHLGGTRVLGLLVTMDAEQGVRTLKLVNAKLNIPIHYDDYTVFKSPLEDFLRAVREAGLEDRLVTLRRGDTYEFEVGGTRPAGSVRRDAVASERERRV